MKSKIWIGIIIAIVLTFTGISYAGPGPDFIPQDFEVGLQLATALPVCVAHGFDIRDALRMDMQHPELREWYAFVEDQFFSGDQVTVNLVYHFTLLGYHMRTGAKESAISLLRSIMASDDFAWLVKMYQYGAPSV